MQVLFSLWLVRRLLTTAALPAGTDVLGFIARARANAAGRQAMSLWSPESFGAVRQITLETPLGVFTKLTGDPVLTVKLFMLATLLGSRAPLTALAAELGRMRAEVGAGPSRPEDEAAAARVQEWFPAGTKLVLQ